MVMIGVAEVVLVLGIMSGLHSDLRNNIVSSDAHVQIVPQRAGQHIETIARSPNSPPRLLASLAPPLIFEQKLFSIQMVMHGPQCC